MVSASSSPWPGISSNYLPSLPKTFCTPLARCVIHSWKRCLSLFWFSISFIQWPWTLTLKEAMKDPSLSTYSQFCQPLSLSPSADFFPGKRVPAYSALCIHPPFPLLNLPCPNASSLRWASQTYVQYRRYRWTIDLYGSIMMLSVLFSGPFLIIPKIWFAF